MRDKQKMVVLGDIPSEMLERFIRAYQCPYCQDGKTYKMLALHIYQIHGISAYEFRARYGMNRGHRLCSHETSALMKQRIQERGGPNKSWVEYDRHKSVLYRYQDGGQREEIITKKKAIARQPEVRKRFALAMSKLDRKAIAQSIDPAVRRARGSKAAKAQWNNMTTVQKKEAITRLRAGRTKESEAVRIVHAKKTMQDKYWADSKWREDWSEKVREGIQRKAKIPRSEYSRIAELANKGLSQHKIAQHYGVSGALISLILRAYRLNLPVLPRRKGKL